MVQNYIFSLLQHYGNPILLIGLAISGVSKVKAGKYALLSLFGSALWCGVFIGLGALLGNQWRIIVSLAKAYSHALLLLLAFLFVTIIFFKKHQKVIFSITFPLLAFIMVSENVINRGFSVPLHLKWNYIRTH